MEMLLRSADFSEETAKISSPMKAFMDNATLITREQKAMNTVLTRMDELVTWSRPKSHEV